MFEMLDAFIGLIFIYTILSLMVTTLMEMLVQFEGLRGTNLQRGIGRLLEDNQRLLKAFYEHPRIKSLQRDQRTLPSYIPTEIFRTVVVEVLSGRPYASIKDRPYALEQAIQGISQPQLRQALLEMWCDAKGDAAGFTQELDNWFNHTQDRTIGWFKSALRKRLFLLGLLVAVAANADTLHMFQNLMADKSLRDAYLTQAMALDQTRFDELRGRETPAPAAAPAEAADAPTEVAVGERLRLIKMAAADVAPVLGWENAQYTPFTPLGWLLTAIALSLGAPFWFDVLQKVVRVRSSLRPPTKGGDEAEAQAQSGGAASANGESPSALPATLDLEDFGLFQPQCMTHNKANAFWMVRFAELAYQDQDGFELRCLDWGLEAEHFTVTTAQVDTQCYLAYNAKLVILVFRGTEASRIPDLVTDLTANLIPCGWSDVFRVHKGFHRALDAVWGELEPRLATLCAGRYLWIGGHSLGGALAALAGSRIAHGRRNQDSPLKDLLMGGVYTCGQPRVGDKAFAEDLERSLGGRYCRIVNNRDLVPILPPPLGYAHAGTLLYLNETGRLMVDPPFWYRALDKLDYSEDREQLRERLKETLGDHRASQYLGLLGRLVESDAS